VVAQGNPLAHQQAASMMEMQDSLLFGCLGLDKAHARTLHCLADGLGIIAIILVGFPGHPSPPQTPPLYRAFKGNSFASCTKADDLEHLLQRNGSVLAFMRIPANVNTDSGAT
jgi:hypothetical protein